LKPAVAGFFISVVYWASMSQSISIRTKAFEATDNGALVVFRILFGLMMFVECLMQIVAGGVKEAFVDPPLLFPAIGFEWLQVLHGPVMFLYVAIMAIAALAVAAGLYFRISSIILATLWTFFYLAQQINYNNHYYLMVLLCWMLALTPANRRLSLDVKQGRAIASNTCPRWCTFLFQFQVSCVFVFAAMAKLYPDWMHGLPLKLWFAEEAGNPYFGFIVRQSWAPIVFSWLGIIFDLLLIPALCFKRSRNIAFIAALFFNFFNQQIFQIGIFPFMALSSTLFFFPASFYDSFLPEEKTVSRPEQASGQKQKIIMTLIIVYILIQLILPIRHFFIKGDVTWTDEGHKMAWRMMLRDKRGFAFFEIVNIRTGEMRIEQPAQRLPERQAIDIPGSPELCWQYAQYLKKLYNGLGQKVKIFVNSEVSLNGRISQPLIDTSVDLAATPWQGMTHKQWILPGPTQ